jgi:maltose alpha-D-glucosyltransferase/alpha-amylase
MIDDLWYKNAIFYCLNVGTFMDANGDGVGDFEGLMRRLDYLAGLGVTALWLMPFQPSPHRDDGYDTQDYYGVDARYGTLGDFVEFTQHARARGIRVIIDLVINHTSDQHPWFQRARRDPTSKYRDYYYWSKKKPAGAHQGMVFPGVQTSTWTYDRQARTYYYHRFYAFQPDLTTENPAVQEEVRKIMGLWLELGKALMATRKCPEIGQWGIFLRTHDELDLGRLSDAQRQQVFDTFAPDEDMRLYGRGIRRRSATDRAGLQLAVHPAGHAGPALWG